MNHTKTETFHCLFCEAEHDLPDQVSEHISCACGARGTVNDRDDVWEEVHGLAEFFKVAEDAIEFISRRASHLDKHGMIAVVCWGRVV